MRLSNPTLQSSIYSLNFLYLLFQLAVVLAQKTAFCSKLSERDGYLLQLSKVALMVTKQNIQLNLLSANHLQ